MILSSLTDKKGKAQKVKVLQVFFYNSEGFCQAAATLPSLLFLQDLSQNLPHSQATVL